MLRANISQLAAVAALLAVCPSGYAGGVALIDTRSTDMPRMGMVRTIRASLSRSNRGRTGGGSKKRKAKRYARAHGRNLTQARR